ncbi:phosphodiester glycosidase family protein [Pseudonocardia sp. HH130630-07]|uniref:phosphodiester glycosidase family protein n=1 Tax=Pseudonocardia sp. HH130630-07 TaxID=1690815 RepID=UPI000A78D4D6|nr:phosphodiester glycosidase family protein [Pseudonocardia sp. HH130630-07]
MWDRVRSRGSAVSTTLTVAAVVTLVPVLAAPVAPLGVPAPATPAAAVVAAGPDSAAGAMVTTPSAAGPADAVRTGLLRGSVRSGGGTVGGDPAAAPAAPAVTHREERIDTPAGPVTTDVVVADLRRDGVRAVLLTGATVAERADVVGHAARGGAFAAVNGDFFDLARSNAPAGPSVRDGRPLTSAVPPGRRLAPAVPGSEPGDALTVDSGGTPRIDRLTLDASASAPDGPLPIRTLNAYAVPVGGIGLFTSDWAGDRNAALCGSDTDRDAPCAPDRVEVVVRDGVVTAVRPPGGGPIPAAEQILTGRDDGAAALRGLEVGDRVTVRSELAAASGAEPRTAVGGSPILRGGAAVPGLDAGVRDPRTAAGITDDGRLVLVTADGREATSAGATLAEMAEQLRRAGAVDGVNLDGGGSSTMVVGGQVVNRPSEDAYRLVPNALGVVAPGP